MLWPQPPSTRVSCWDEVRLTLCLKKALGCSINLMLSLEPSGQCVGLSERCLTQQHGEGPFIAGFQPVWIRK